MSAIRVRSALLCLAAAGALSMPASAERFRDSSAGAVCQAANGAVAAKFNRTLTYITNAGTTDAYVICHLPMDDASSTPDHVSRLTVEVTIPNAGGNVACVAQSGAYYQGANHIYASQAQSYTAAGPNESATIDWTVPMYRLNVFNVLTLNCKLPPGAKLGLIERWEAPNG